MKYFNSTKVAQNLLINKTLDIKNKNKNIFGINNEKKKI